MNNIKKGVVTAMVVGTTNYSVQKWSYLKKFNPYILYVVILIVCVIALFKAQKKAKRKTYESVAMGAIAGSTISIAAIKSMQIDCEPAYRFNCPQNDSVLVNYLSGKVLQTIGTPKLIYVTTQTTKEKGWEHSALLTHCVKSVEGIDGGVSSKRGDPVLWSTLPDLTQKFNKTLSFWIEYFEKLKPYYDFDGINKLRFWINAVTDNAILDIKSKDYPIKRISEWSLYNNTLVRYDDYGNILYGAAGAAFGFSLWLLIMGANINQFIKSGPDEDKDKYSIMRGFKSYSK